MPARLDIDYIEIKNFLSYGNYETKFQVANRGPVLVLGEIEENGTDVSNGAGKSSLVTAFVWCLFGRTISNRAPGDKIVNWYSGKDCYVKIVTTDGWEITRTRNIDGHSELLISKDDEDKTQSTSINAQKFLQSHFGLDYDIFTASVFCGQFGKSFLEMTAAKRKEAVERLLGVDKLNQYADLAKEKYKEVELDQSKIRTKIDLVKADCKRQQERLEEILDEQKEFEEERASQLTELSKQATDAQQAIEQIEALDVNKIKRQWQLIDQIFDRIKDYQQEFKSNDEAVAAIKKSIRQAEQSFEAYAGWSCDNIDIEKLKSQHELASKAEAKLKVYVDQLMVAQTDKYCLDRDVSELFERINKWELKSGAICSTCEQEVSDSHVEHTTKPLIEQLKNKKEKLHEVEKLVSQLKEIKTKLDSVQRPNMTVEEAERLIALNEQTTQDIKAIGQHISDAEEEIESLQKTNVVLDKKISDTSAKLEAAKPEISLEEIQDYLVDLRSLKDRHQILLDKVDEVKAAKNPFRKVVVGLEEAIGNLQSDVVDLEAKMVSLDLLFSHYKYIYRSYSDRRKIKSWLLSELIPFLNSRVHYYLGALGIDIDISFNSTLDAKTDKWDYEFCSGGERKRMDLAIMFGLYDLYMSIYGKQCNIMVLDEVDSRLDKQSVEAFADVINDFNSDNNQYPRPSTILVISHKHELKDLVPSQVVIKKRNGFSIIDQT